MPVGRAGSGSPNLYVWKISQKLCSLETSRTLPPSYRTQVSLGWYVLRIVTPSPQSSINLTTPPRSLRTLTVSHSHLCYPCLATAVMALPNSSYGSLLALSVSASLWLAHSAVSPCYFNAYFNRQEKKKPLSIEAKHFIIFSLSCCCQCCHRTLRLCI